MLCVLSALSIVACLTVGCRRSTRRVHTRRRHANSLLLVPLIGYAIAIILTVIFRLFPIAASI